MTTGSATAQSQRNRSEPWGGGAMQKDHTGMMPTLQFQTDSCIWEHSSALFKGRGGSLRSGKPATLGAEVGLWPPRRTLPLPAVSGGSSCLSVMCVGRWCKAGRGFCCNKTGCAEVLGDAAHSWAGTSGSPPCSRHHLSRVSLAGAGSHLPVQLRCSGCDTGTQGLLEWR